MKKLILVTVMLLVLVGCKNTYEPVYYPNKDDLTKYIEGPKFSTAEDAREWIYAQNRIRGDRDWDYEIGVNCRPSGYGDIKVCEDTIQ